MIRLKKRSAIFTLVLVSTLICLTAFINMYDTTYKPTSLNQNEKLIKERKKQSKNMNILTKVKQLFSNELEIIQYQFPSGTYIKGRNLPLSFVLKQKHNNRIKYMAEYYIQDPMGDKIKLDEKEVCFQYHDEKIFSMNPVLSHNRDIVSGPYKVILIIKDIEEGDILIQVEKYGELMLFNHIDTFDTLDKSIWEVREFFPLGSGYLLEENIENQENTVSITVTDEKNGGEFRSIRKMEYGSFQVRLKVAHAPGSITGFFLYSPPDFFHEIDIEIYNDPTGTVLFTVYKEGEKAKHIEYKLGFDPTDSFHTYRFDVYKDQICFYVDDMLLQQWNGSYSTAPMQLMINSWYPNWLQPSPIMKPKTIIDEIRY